MEKIIKKADIYLSSTYANNDKTRITIDISETLSIEEILNNILYAINRNTNQDNLMGKIKLESIYFREEKINAENQPR